MISSVGYVPLNVLKRQPTVADVTEEDLQQLRHRLEETMRQPDDDDTSEEERESMEIDEQKTEAIRAAEETARQALVAPDGVGPTDRELDEAMKELHFEDYDSEDDVTNTSFLDRIVMAQPGEIHVKNESDDEVGSEEDDEDSSSNAEEREYHEDDILFLATKAEDMFSCIEIWLYEDADDSQGGNLFVHHDIPLANFPLCCAYLDVQPGMGCMECDVELYDLDVLDAVSPVTILHSTSKKERSSTMSMSANESARNVLASGGDDKHIRIWDISTGAVTAEMKLHKSTVQSVEWNPNEAPILVSGGHDKKCVMTDVRTPDGTVLQWKLGTDNESVAWCLHQPSCFLASDEDGTVQMFDARKGSKSEALFSLAAHKDNTTVVSVCPLQPTLFMTGSEDGRVKIWDLKAEDPQLVDKKSLGTGEILAGGFCKHAGHLVVAAGDNGKVRVWDLRASAKAVQHFPDSVYIPQIYKHQS